MFRYTKLVTPNLCGHRHRFILKTGNITPVLFWCDDNFGCPVQAMTGSRWYALSAIIYFRDDDDAFAFRMRWCGA